MSVVIRASKVYNADDGSFHRTADAYSEASTNIVPPGDVALRSSIIFVLVPPLIRATSETAKTSVTASFLTGIQHWISLHGQQHTRIESCTPGRTARSVRSVCAEQCGRRRNSSFPTSDGIDEYQCSFAITRVYNFYRVDQDIAGIQQDMESR